MSALSSRGSVRSKRQIVAYLDEHPQSQAKRRIRSRSIPVRTEKRWRGRCTALQATPQGAYLSVRTALKVGCQIGWVISFVQWKINVGVQLKKSDVQVFAALDPNEAEKPRETSSPSLRLSLAACKSGHEQWNSWRPMPGSMQGLSYFSRGACWALQPPVRSLLVSEAQQQACLAIERVTHKQHNAGHC